MLRVQQHSPTAPSGHAPRQRGIGQRQPTVKRGQGDICAAQNRLRLRAETRVNDLFVKGQRIVLNSGRQHEALLTWEFDCNRDEPAHQITRTSRTASFQCHSWRLSAAKNKKSST